MGRHVGRSRGCKTCVTRRIKCNEETPVCFQCVSAGFECPGPVQGAIFIDMSEGIKQKSSRTISKSSSKKTRTALGQISRSLKCVRNVSQPSKLPSMRQPSQRDIFQDLYIANFISAQDATMHPWIQELPQLTSPSSTYLSELYGIRAVTLALYAKLSHNRDLELEASKWYSKGLLAQKRELHLALNPESYSPCRHKAIGAAVMFSYFESVIATVPMGWIQHYAAAIKMFEIAGPENCQAGLMHKFFRSVRVAAFITSLLADERSALSSELWCTVPFSNTPKTPFDTLVDILLQLPSCLPLRNEMRKNAYSNPTKSGLLKRQLGIAANNLFSRLDEFWEDYKEDIDPDYDQRLQQISCTSTFITEDWFTPHHLPCSHHFPFKSASDAYFTSMYDSGKLIVLGFLASISTGTSWYNYNRDIVMHGTSVLASATYCETLGVFNGVNFSMVFPIKLVCLLSPSEEQREMAREVLLKWGEERGLLDTCQVAAPSYLDRSHG
ncbi:hypothetical protein N431DRAFT_547735 [Stipitochalara longipes BDJ]|nr:hypothetical protein N431DRAFT_547735 [Stipitochalara longipes BDJ]